MDLTELPFSQEAKPRGDGGVHLPTPAEPLEVPAPVAHVSDGCGGPELRVDGRAAPGGARGPEAAEGGEGADPGGGAPAELGVGFLCLMFFWQVFFFGSCSGFWRCRFGMLLLRRSFNFA